MEEMKKIKRFWIYSNTYGVIDECFTLVFIGKLEAAKAECERLNELGKDNTSSYEVIKLTDKYSSEIFENLEQQTETH